MRFLLSCFILLYVSHLHAQQPLFDAFQWRMIGPHRGGRTVGACGVPQQPNTFYIGVNNGGVWKTTDAGRTWMPIFDEQPTGSIGDVAVAPSNPNVVYAASGEGLQRPDLSVGDGMYKSTDAGKTWINTGLRDGLQIGGLSIDPKDENRVFAAVLGHPYGPNTERGVFRTTDGGKTWAKVLYVDENTGAVQVSIDPNNPQIVYADLWEARLGPWENGIYQGVHSGLYKSTDGGSNWKQLTNGLPTTAQGLGRIGFCIAPSDSKRLYATVDAGELGGIYRSDDAGETWKRMSADERLWSRGSDFAEVKVDPKNPDILYSANVVTWKSTNGGQSWTAFRGAPGGDDYHRLWINPDNPDIILIASDQGAIITVNGGQTFSSWYNQPTAQFYHVSTDNAFPYNVYGGQQESGSVGIASRGNDGQITFREWHPVGVEEYGYVAADPLDPNIIYGGKISKFDKRTGQTQNISPEAVRSGQYRFIRTAPVLFSPVDLKTLYFAGNVLFKTQNGGHSWDVISPDLSRESWDIPASVGVFKNDAASKDQRRRGVIYAVAPSQQNVNTIWAGTDDGLIHRTLNGGKTWTNITPPEVTPWSKVSQLEASHFNNNTCYAAINRIRLDDLRPHILRTRDGGKTWQEIVAGLPNEPINTVREDPIQPGLLFAGSEGAVYMSLDDGEHWQSLRLNMPATSIRDLVIKDNDIVVGTHGRSFWILDDISPLRRSSLHAEASEKAGAPAENLMQTGSPILFKPQTTYRVRWNMNTDTPLPQEEPAGQNPPDGAIINYYLPKDADAVVSLKIFDGYRLVRQYNSNDQTAPENLVNIPGYWKRPQQILSAKAGSHRFLWDLCYTPLNVPSAYPIAAIYGNTAPEPTGMMVPPGTYIVELTVGDVKIDQRLTVESDPRLDTRSVDFKEQYELSLRCYVVRQHSMEALAELGSLRAQIRERLPLAKTNLEKQLQALDLRAAALEGGKEPGFRNANGAATSLFNVLQDNDMTPTLQTGAAVTKLDDEFGRLWGAWKSLKDTSLILINANLKKAGIPEITFLDQAGPRQHPDTREKGWVNVFNKDLSNATSKPGIWSVTDGVFTATEDECLWTKKVYKDFVLDLEFKTADGTNSGVIVHCSDTDNWIPNSVEIQIADDYSAEWANAPTTWQCGAIFGHLPAKMHQVKKPGEWNHYTITCKDRKIWVVLNGESVTEMDMSRWTSASMNPDGTTIPPWLSKPFATLPLQGHIGFQGKHAGAPIYFRNLKIKELK